MEMMMRDIKYLIRARSVTRRTNNQIKKKSKQLLLKKKKLSQIVCLRSKATWSQKCTEMQWNISWWQKGKRRFSALALALAIL